MDRADASSIVLSAPVLELDRSTDTAGAGAPGFAPQHIAWPAAEWAGPRTLVAVPERPHRPVPSADIAALVDALGGYEQVDPAEVAALTAAAVVTAGRDGGVEDVRLIELSDRVGLDTMAQVWGNAEPASLAWSLWTMYLLRGWCRDHAEEAARLWHAGRGLAPADEVVAGVAEDGGARPIAELADSVLRGAYRGELSVALDRAAAFFRVVAQGRRTIAEGDADSTEQADQTVRADRNEHTADLLALAASLERNGQLR